jgi:hypothetical protein
VKLRRATALVIAAGALAALATLTLAAGGPTSRPAASRGPVIGGCPVFPASNAWNRDVSHDPLDPRSSAYIASINSHGPQFLHADFGGGGHYGIPYGVASRSQPRVPIHFTDYGAESDRGPYPIPPGARIEEGSDRHVLIAQRGTCRMFELFNAQRSGRGWNASSGAVFDMRSNRLRHEGFTSADAAGLSIIAGLARYDEVRAGAIRHALRFTVSHSQGGYIHPATHRASSRTDPNLPPMGLRLRLKASYPTGRFHGQARVILTALKRYGMLVADNGSDWYITGGSDRRWNDEDLNQLKGVPGSAFEVVSSGRIRHTTG